MEKRPMVDVNVATYNHEKYIAAAIESVLAQETDFEYRLIVGDDCSTDNTQAIIRSYAEKYPGRIVTVFEPKNLGPMHRDRVGVKIFNLSTAKYVALLDGDDYWTDPRKLQKQVDFLESHPDFAVSYHNVKLFHEDGSKPPCNVLPDGHKEVSTVEDLLRVNFIYTCSVMYRRGVFGALPEWYYGMPTGDWSLHILHAEHGKIGYIKDVMAAYRVHQKGYWSVRDHFRSLENEMRLLKAFNKHLNYRYHGAISGTLRERFKTLAEGHKSRGNVVKAHTFALRHFFERFGSESLPAKYLLLSLLGRYFPSLYATLRGLKRSSRKSHALL